MCQLLSVGLLGVFSFFVAPVAAEFGVGVAVINIGPVFFLLAPALVGPLTGRFADGYSIRSLMLIGVLIGVTALLALSTAATLAWLALGFLGFAVGQCLYGPLILNTLLVKTYQASAARALGLAAMGVSVGSVALPYIVAWLMDTRDWRETVTLLACGVGLILLVTIRVGLPRLPPESLRVHVGATNVVADHSFMRRRAFWVIGIAAAVIGNAVVVAVISYGPHFTNLGFDNRDIATFIAAAGGAGFLAKVFVAVFVDQLRAHLKLIALVIIGLLIAGLLTLMLGQSYRLAICGTALLGAAGGGFIPFHPYLNSAHFAAEVMGRVNGAQAPLMLPLGLVGLPLAGFVFDSTGSYQWVFAGCALLAGVAALLVLALPAAGPGLSETEKYQQAAEETE
ncbi:MFS transporter [Candidatus Litorirhabdus singularis]|uniref:MFS transporter n=1 Tax=Candidatus Litorirhabdus singularis TaxID=2518993 RepID=UPI00242CB1A8|nr:MFS transporter [Candidatus Litorirhabdus singularis]